MSLLLVVLAIYVGLSGGRTNHRAAAVFLAAAAGVDYGLHHLYLAAVHGLLAWALWRAEDVARHYHRLRRAGRRLRHMEICWDGFGVTRGGFFIYDSGYFRAVDPAPLIGELVLAHVASGGLCAPQTASDVPAGVHWRQWQEWHKPISIRMRFPTVAAPRGGITYRTP